MQYVHDHGKENNKLHMQKGLTGAPWPQTVANRQLTRVNK